MTKLLARFIQNPLQIGAVAPSSPWLASAMVRQADLSGNVLELGAGTGPITKRLLVKMDPAAFETVELDPALVQHLQKRFPQARVHAEDAEAFLQRTNKRYRSILSGIAFVWMEKDKRHRLFELIRDRLEPGGRFVMFQYSKITEAELRSVFGDSAVTSVFVPLNIPPAFVFTCRK